MQMELIGDGLGNNYTVERGVPLEYAKKGATTIAAYQQMAAQDLSDKQVKAQTEVASQQQTFNEKQFQAQEDLQQKQQTQVDEQAQRQSTYDTGRAQLLSEGTQQINDAFSRFSPDYFDRYAKDYMSKATDDISYQKNLATKEMLFGLARQGIGQSQAKVNQAGILEETAGRATADQTTNAQAAENALKANVSGAKQNLLGQVTASQSIGSPIAAGDMGGVNQALQTQRSAISGIASNAGDVTSSLKGVPTVSSLGNIFAGVLSGAGSYLGGVNANNAYGNYQRALAGLGGTSPSASSTSTGGSSPFSGPY
jgi:hypothetical protein